MYKEARNTWEVGKSLGLQSENDDLVIESLAKSIKSRDDVLCPINKGRRRGRRKASRKESP